MAADATRRTSVAEIAGIASNHQEKTALVLRRTKFYRPAAPQDLVIRPRLLDKLSQGLSRPLTLVSAPAGYGKTSLVSSFLETSALPWAWLSLDENDNDLRLFLDYLLTALDNLFPGSLHRTQLLLAGPTLPPTTLMALMVGHDMSCPTAYEKGVLQVGIVLSARIELPGGLCYAGNDKTRMI